MSTKDRLRPALEPLTDDELAKKLEEGDQVFEEAEKVIQTILKETGASLIERPTDEQESHK
ncbi:MAG TPA: hypothetical protein V6D08_04090 [Candidatus Obscuribacterales bacterium]